MRPCALIRRAGMFALALVAISVLSALCESLTLADDVADAGSAAIPEEHAIDDQDRDHWAYRPLSAMAPPEVNDPRWRGNPIDRFVFSQLQEAGIQPLPKASKTARLRRMYLDLTGLPPSADEVRQFLADDRADAYERKVDQLLAATAYGERYAQHWLDLARFAETDGFEHDLLRPNAWRYRDWVIGALNADLPYDQFIKLQLAGDLAAGNDPQDTIATGFLLCGPDMPDINLQDERRHQVLNEMASTVGAVLLGLQVGCAQCHDHKYDPISQYDFYRLRACFESAELFQEKPVPTREQAAARAAAESQWTQADRDGAKRRRALEELARKRFREKNPDARPTLEEALAELDTNERGEHSKLVERLDPLPALPDLPLGRVVREGPTRAAVLYLRGDFRRPGPEVQPGVPRVLTSSLTSSLTTAAKTAATSTTSGATHLLAGANSRTALADWIAQPGNPLVLRVMVNRIWQWHFGAGLVSSASDFGQMGTPPTQPELLDYLAARFAADGWSMKRLHRLIVTSETYQLASAPFDPSWTTDEIAAAQQRYEAAMAVDPHNEHLWRRQRMRLDGESVRDALLAASGQLSERRGGPGVRPSLPPEVKSTLLRDQWIESADEEDHRRRSVYLFVRRNLRLPLLEVFDRPDTNASCPVRHESTTATQSLALLNSEFSLAAAQGLAARLLKSAPQDQQQQIEQLYLTVLNRPPSPEEVRSASEFLTHQAALLAAEGRTPESLALPTGLWTTHAECHAAAAMVDLCLALLNCNEFVYAD